MIDDVFLHRLIQQIQKSYDEWYLSSKSYKKNRPMYNYAQDKKKRYHIHMLLLHYDRERFVSCKNLYEERVKFLNEVQQIVDITGG